MITTAQALSAVPAGLRAPLITEYQGIVQNFLEHRWLPSELSGGRFSEVVYTILNGHAQKSYPSTPAKPAKFVDACRKLESVAQPHIPRSFQILIPRMLPVLYEVRNNRNVGHVGGDVDPNYMDSLAVVAMSSWVMAELVRVFHGLTVPEAQKVVDMLAEQRIPVVWSDGAGTKRVLRPELKLKQQLLLLIATSLPDVTSRELLAWIENDDTGYVIKTLRNLHRQRYVEFSEKTDRVRILPPGAKYIQDMVREKNLLGIA